MTRRWSSPRLILCIISKVIRNLKCILSFLFMLYTSTSQYVHLEYINFVGQAQLWNKLLTSDRRFALEWQPCSRCLERGTKCSHRIVLRTGGGYIVLDCSDLSEDDKQKLFGNHSSLPPSLPHVHIYGKAIAV